MSSSSSGACEHLKCFEMFKEHCRSIESQQNKALSDITGSVAFARSTDTSAFDDTWTKWRRPYRGGRTACSAAHSRGRREARWTQRLRQGQCLAVPSLLAALELCESGERLDSAACGYASLPLELSSCAWKPETITTISAADEYQFKRENYFLF